MKKAYRRAFTSDEAISEILRLRELSLTRTWSTFSSNGNESARGHEDLDDFLGAAAVRQR